MVAKVIARSKKAAQEAVKDKIIFHKTEPVDGAVDRLKDIFGI